MGELIYVNFIPPYRGRIDEEDLNSSVEDEEGLSSYDEVESGEPLLPKGRSF